MDGSAGYEELLGNVGIRFLGVPHQDRKNFSVQVINFGSFSHTLSFLQQQRSIFE
jgi:hypothetical protein